MGKIQKTEKSLQVTESNLENEDLLDVHPLSPLKERKEVKSQREGRGYVTGAEFDSLEDKMRMREMEHEVEVSKLTEELHRQKEEHMMTVTLLTEDLRYCFVLVGTYMNAYLHASWCHHVTTALLVAEQLVFHFQGREKHSGSIKRAGESQEWCIPDATLFSWPPNTTFLY